GKPGAPPSDGGFADGGPFVATGKSARARIRNHGSVSTDPWTAVRSQRSVARAPARRNPSDLHEGGAPADERSSRRTERVLWKQRSEEHTSELQSREDLV